MQVLICNPQTAQQWTGYALLATRRASLCFLMKVVIFRHFFRLQPPPPEFPSIAPLILPSVAANVQGPKSKILASRGGGVYLDFARATGGRLGLRRDHTK